MDLSDPVLDRLRQVAAIPDLGQTRYVLEKEMGRGAMGIVYAAHDRDLDRPVALKVLDSTFAAEAQLIARLEHPAVVPIYETGVLPDGRCFYAMKLIAGTRLDKYAAGSPSLAERLRVLRRVAEVLAFAHDDDVDVGRSVGLRRQGVGVAGSAAKHIRVRRLDPDDVGIGPVVVQPLPGAAPALGDVGVVGALAMHLEGSIGAVSEDLRAARSEVGESGDELFGGRGGRLVEMDRGHYVLLARVS